MIILLFISLHVLLLSLYALAIEKGISRLQTEHLLFALCLPIAGQLALLLAEFGSFQSARDRISPFEPEPGGPVRGKGGGIIPIPEAPIQRAFLLNAIKKNPENLTQLLKRALKSEDSEVVHIAAANIMRIQQSHESTISACSREYARISEDMRLLEDYVAAIDAYLATELPEGESRKQLLEIREQLLAHYRKTFPQKADRARSPVTLS